eukprot:g7181.t1
MSRKEEAQDPMVYVFPKYPYRFLAGLPIAICLGALSVIVAAVSLANRQAGHLPPGVTFPPISLAMAKDPERTLGQVGFPLVAFLFVIAYLPFKNVAVGSVEKRHKDTVSNACWAALVGFVCLGIVGGIPLQDNAVDLMSTNNRGTKPALETQSIIHQLAAAIFFMCSIWHSSTMLGIMQDTSSPILNANDKRNYWSYFFKQGSMYMMFLPAVVSFALHPTSSLSKILHLDKVIKAGDIGGISQYIAVFAVMIFFTSYSIDFYHCHKLSNIQSNKTD